MVIEKRNEALSDMEILKYSRQLTHPDFGLIRQKRLKNSTVLIAGIGGLGGSAVWQLAGAGIGRLILVHPGNVEEPDLNRQTLMTQDWIGKPRTDRAIETIKHYNPLIEVVAHNCKIEPKNFQSLLYDVDLVIDARHNFRERRIINKVCVKTKTPYIEVAMNGLDGYIFSVKPRHSACLECVYPEDPPLWDPLGFPVFGAVSAAMGSVAAMEAIKFLSDYESRIFGVMTYFDFSDMSNHQYKLKRNEECPVCGGRK